MEGFKNNHLLHAGIIGVLGSYVMPNSIPKPVSIIGIGGASYWYMKKYGHGLPGSKVEPHKHLSRHQRHLLHLQHEHTKNGHKRLRQELLVRPHEDEQQVVLKRSNYNKVPFSHKPRFLSKTHFMKQSNKPHNDIRYYGGWKPPTYS